MTGKVLKVDSNDLYGNADDRLVRVYACFEHTKYMNNYVVFSFDGDMNKLHYGSLHLKNNSLVVFEVKDNVNKYIDEFLTEYMNNKLDNYKIIDIKDKKKIELVSYNSMDYKDIDLLDDKAILKVVLNEVEEVTEKKPVFLYVVIFLLIVLGLGITLLYFKPELFMVKYKYLECTNRIYDDNIGLFYKVDKKVMFDKNDKVDYAEVVRTYGFLDSASYNSFKNNNDYNMYFTNGEGYKFIDNELVFKVFYNEKTVIDDYEEMFTYMKREGYSCVEREYEK